MVNKTEDTPEDIKTRKELYAQLDELMGKAFPIPPVKLTLTKDYRGLKAGLTAEFKHRFVAVVGDNGAGKSSFLNLFRSFWKGHYMGRVREAADHMVVEGLEAFDLKLDYFTDSDSARGQSMADVSYSMLAVGMAAFQSSSGELQNEHITKLVKQILKQKPTLEKPALLVLDEPESSLSLRARVTLATTLHLISSKFPVMIVVATHDESMIAAAARVYDITTGDTHRDGKGYVDGIRAEVEADMEKKFGA